MQCWHWLPREVVAVSSLETSKVRSDQAGLVEDVPAFCRGVGLDGLQRSLPTQTLYIKIKMEGGKWLAQGNFCILGSSSRVRTFSNTGKGQCHTTRDTGS